VANGRGPKSYTHGGPLL
jgi:hypothetical protein